MENPDSANKIKKDSFEKSIEIGKHLTVQEAIEKLSLYHNNTSQDSILAAFFNLRNFFQEEKNGTVVFNIGANPDTLTMRFFVNGKEKNPMYYDIVNRYTGNPGQHVH